MNEVQTTERGFEFIEFKDANNEPCTLQQSSAIAVHDFERGNENPGSSFVWLGCEKNAKPVDGHEMSPRMHLDRERVEALLQRLVAWLRTGSFVDAETTNANYMEVLVDISVNCGNLIAKDEITIVDSRTVPDTCRRLADEFTLLHKDEDWSEHDYIETVDEFADRRLREEYPLKG